MEKQNQGRRASQARREPWENLEADGEGKKKRSRGEMKEMEEKRRR